MEQFPRNLKTAHEFVRQIFMFFSVLPEILGDLTGVFPSIGKSNPGNRITDTGRITDIFK